ncbi:MAG: TPR domain protein [Candidatus Magnetoglobus multicellularis str. Araruama]|uniref:TPR domain protein n=1 Tax=Candidatus Magnetoglobus multicellularis str. Araruama TaxID=890399 RepID=A0A1V1P928_9BACT|nr:MAG: TPR domain protein [Candidatus Magnetoglobus multicellularis str. Araruama]
MKMPQNELIIHLKSPEMLENKKATAIAEIKFISKDSDQKEIMTGSPFQFECPDPINQDDLNWYLNQYPLWPVGGFQEKATKFENQLFKWGKLLFDAINTDETRPIFKQWHSQTENGRLTLIVENNHASEAANQILNLPWKLLNNGETYFCLKEKQFCIRHEGGKTNDKVPQPVDSKIRVLIVSPRPSHKDDTNYRITALPMLRLGHVLNHYMQCEYVYPSTFSAFLSYLDNAAEKGQPFHVIHFDGYAVFQDQTDLPGLCFEKKSSDDIHSPQADIINANQLSEIIQKYSIPLMFLIAHQIDNSPMDPVTALADILLEKGLNSVVVMKHRMPEKRVRSFLYLFYRELIEGKSPGDAMFEGQKAIKPYESIHDWFLPVLMQKHDDYPLFKAKDVDMFDQEMEENDDLPIMPAYGFIGRSRELLFHERILENYPWTVIQGEAGEGKTSLALELGRWLTYTHRIILPIHIEIDHASDYQDVIETLWLQTMPNTPLPDSNGEAYSKVLDVLKEKKFMIIFDDIDAVFPYKDNLMIVDPQVSEDIFDICKELIQIPGTRLCFITRQPLPEPFNTPEQTAILKGMDHDDAIRLVYESMTYNKLDIKEAPGNRNPDLHRLVRSVKCHAKALQYLGPTVHRRGVNISSKRMQRHMNQLQKHFPDERKRALCVSLELCLQQIPEDLREKMDHMSLFTQGANSIVLSVINGEIFTVMRRLIDKTYDECGDIDETIKRVKSIEESAVMKEKALKEIYEVALSISNEYHDTMSSFGLVEYLGMGHISLHPELIEYVRHHQVKPELYSRNLERWEMGMRTVIDMIYSKMDEHADLVDQFALLELPNLIGFLDFLRKQGPSQLFFDVCDAVEDIADHLERYQIGDYVDEVRTKMKTEYPSETNHLDNQGEN